jgi:hypothetical protein
MNAAALDCVALQSRLTGMVLMPSGTSMAPLQFDD